MQICKYDIYIYISSVFDGKKEVLSYVSVNYEIVEVSDNKVDAISRC